MWVRLARVWLCKNILLMIERRRRRCIYHEYTRAHAHRELVHFTQQQQLHHRHRHKKNTPEPEHERTRIITAMIQHIFAWGIGGGKKQIANSIPFRSRVTPDCVPRVCGSGGGCAGGGAPLEAVPALSCCEEVSLGGTLIIIIELDCKTTGLVIVTWLVNPFGLVIIFLGQ